MKHWSNGRRINKRTGEESSLDNYLLLAHIHRIQQRWHERVDLSKFCKVYHLPTMYSQGEYKDIEGRNYKGFYDKLIYHE
jgi:hypothetical protein